MMVLSVVRAHGESYGYAIRQHIKEAGIVGLGEAAVYACLRRLQKRGLLTSREMEADNGKTRRCYSLTDAGETDRLRLKEAWESRHDAVTRIIDPVEVD